MRNRINESSNLNHHQFILPTIDHPTQAAVIEYVLHCKDFVLDDMAMSGLVGYGSSDEEDESLTSKSPIRKEVDFSDR